MPDPQARLERRRGNFRPDRRQRCLEQEDGGRALKTFPGVRLEQAGATGGCEQDQERKYSGL